MSTRMMRRTKPFCFRSRPGFILLQRFSFIYTVYIYLCCSNHLLAASNLLSEKQGRPLFEKEMAGSHVQYLKPTLSNKLYLENQSDRRNPTRKLKRKSSRIIIGHMEPSFFIPPVILPCLTDKAKAQEPLGVQ